MSRTSAGPPPLRRDFRPRPPPPPLPLRRVVLSARGEPASLALSALQRHGIWVTRAAEARTGRIQSPSPVLSSVSPSLALLSASSGSAKSEWQDGGAQDATLPAVGHHGASTHPGPGGPARPHCALQGAAEPVTTQGLLSRRKRILGGALGWAAGEAGLRARRARPTRGLRLCGARLGLLGTTVCPGSEGAGGGNAGPQAGCEEAVALAPQAGP